MVTGLALLTTGVIFGGHLREGLRFCEIGFVATRAEYPGIWQLRHHGYRIFYVLLECPVAGLAVHDRVFTCGFHLNDIVVAVPAGFVSGKGHRPRRDVFEGIGTVVPVHSETFRNEQCPHEEEQEKHGKEHCCEPEKMFGVLELGQASSFQVLGYGNTRNEANASVISVTG